MVRSKKRSSSTVFVKQKVSFKVSRVPFTRFESVRHLDVARLSRAKSAQFEVGSFESGCCRRIVHAIVKNGRVVKLQAERCKHPAPMTPESRKLVQTVRKKLGHSPFRPVPVSKFLGGSRGLIIDISFCFIICIFNYCLLCCYDSDPGPNDASGCDFGKWPVAR
jgi:hypothetical protein